MTTPIKIEAVLDISAAAFEEIKARFEASGLSILTSIDNRPTLFFPGVALRKESEDNIRAYLVYQGKVLPKEKHGKSESGTGSSDPEAAT